MKIDGKAQERVMRGKCMLLLGNNPYRVNDSGYVAQYCQQYVQPKMFTQADLQKDAQWR